MSDGYERDMERITDDVETASVVYDELGRLLNDMQPVIDAFGEHGFEHTDAYELLTERQARYRSMRGYLVEIFGEEVRD